MSYTFILLNVNFPTYPSNARSDDTTPTSASYRVPYGYDVLEDWDEDEDE